MNLIPSFNECADKLIEKLRLIADGITSISISKEFSSFTLDVISKVWSDWGMLREYYTIILHWWQVAFGSDFSEPEWEGVYKLKHDKGEQGLLYLVSHALRGAQLSLALPLLRVLSAQYWVNQLGHIPLSLLCLAVSRLRWRIPWGSTCCESSGL